MEANNPSPAGREQSAVKRVLPIIIIILLLIVIAGVYVYLLLTRDSVL